MKKSFASLQAISHAANEYSLCFDHILSRLIIRLRPLICPFEILLEAVPATESVLDIGCGTGFWLYLISKFKTPRNLSGIESNTLRINETKKAFFALSRPVSLIRTKSPDDWPSEDFGVVSMIDVLHHIPPASQESFFRSAARRVADGGCLIYKDMCVHPAWKRVANQLHDLIIARQRIHHVDVKIVESWAADEGLNLHTTANISRYWYGHELRCFTKKNR
jgi:SAM-dependent methyltransferase